MVIGGPIDSTGGSGGGIFARILEISVYKTRGACFRVVQPPPPRPGNRVCVCRSIKVLPHKEFSGQFELVIEPIEYPLMIEGASVLLAVVAGSLLIRKPD